MTITPISISRENPKRRTYLTYFKYGVYDAVINDKKNETYYKSSAYYKQGWDYGRGILLHAMQEDEKNDEH